MPREPEAMAAEAGRQAHDGNTAVVYGAGRDLARTIRTHLFCVCPNHSGSTFLRRALATSEATWNLRREGQRTAHFWPSVAAPGFPRGHKFWTLHPDVLERMADPARYDWARTRKMWYFQAHARRPDASVFVARSPRFLFMLPMLADFANAKFLFMVRNPYANCEGFCRAYRKQYGDAETSAIGDGFDSLEVCAATHVANCLAQQRRNLEAFSKRGVFFTYEAMCAEPERVAAAIQGLVPALADLNLRQRLAVRAYDETLTDMNTRQIARLDAKQIAAMNTVFRPRRELLAHFDYELMEAPPQG